MAEHYFTKKPSSRLNLKKIKVVISGVGYEFFSGSGVFSKSKVDFGSRVLAENMLVKENDDVLDLGCGIGVIGRVAREKTKGKVVLVDINKRAVKLSKMNMKGLDNVEVFQGSMYENLQGRKFDVILLNPPQTAGKKVCLTLISKAKDYLKKGGSLQLVARHNKGGESLSLYMKEVYGNLETLVKKGGYRVYLSRA
tara:strand:+ start:2158 stop:2745 length:588 start_codon:yes stop_codon:yes gene_type:complete